MAVTGAPFDRGAVPLFNLFDSAIFDTDDQGGNFYEEPIKVRKTRKARTRR